jgi:1-acyl-sn-glycerol-3-phosphate acyltransferase
MVAQTHTGYTAPRGAQLRSGLQLQEKVAYRLGRAALELFAALALQLDVVWRAPLPPGPKIIAANHPTTTDPFLLLAVMPEQLSLLITEMAFAAPGFGAYLRCAGHIPVMRGQGRAAVTEALERLAAGGNIGIFPEGQLSPLETSGMGLAAPRTGVARLALSTGAPVIPVGIALQPERIHFVETEVQDMHQTARWYLRGPYAVTVGAPMRFTGSVENHVQVRDAAAQIMAGIGTLIQASRRRLPVAAATHLRPRLETLR